MELSNTGLSRPTPQPAVALTDYVQQATTCGVIAEIASQQALAGVMMARTPVAKGI